MKRIKEDFKDISRHSNKIKTIKKIKGKVVCNVGISILPEYNSDRTVRGDIQTITQEIKTNKRSNCINIYKYIGCVTPSYQT